MIRPVHAIEHRRSKGSQKATNLERDKLGAQRVVVGVDGVDLQQRVVLLEQVGGQLDVAQLLHHVQFRLQHHLRVDHGRAVVSEGQRKHGQRQMAKAKKGRRRRGRH